MRESNPETLFLIHGDFGAISDLDAYKKAFADNFPGFVLNVKRNQPTGSNVTYLRSKALGREYNFCKLCI